MTESTRRPMPVIIDMRPESLEELEKQTLEAMKTRKAIHAVHTEASPLDKILPKKIFIKVG